MAGMEQRFERSLRDKHWSKPLLAFVNENDVNTPERVGRMMEKALCAEYRDDCFPHIHEIVQNFQEIHFQLSKADRWNLSIVGASEVTLFDQYQAQCAPYREAASQHPSLFQIETLIDLGYDHLRAACGDYTLLAASPADAAGYLVSEFFRKHVIGKLAPARELSVHKRGHSPEEVSLRQEEALRFLPFVKIVVQAIQGKKRIIASRTKRNRVELTDSVAIK